MKILLVLAILAAIIFMPVLVIWALNLLFHTGIPYGLDTWFAVIVLSATVKSTTSK